MLRQLCIIFTALLLSAAVWWIGPLVAIGVYQPLASVWTRGVLVAILLTWGFWPVSSYLIGKLFRQPLRPVVRSRKQLDRVTARFHDACRTLRHVGLAAQRTFWQRLAYRFSSVYLHDRPWYLMLGPSNSGKSSLVAGSGQHLLLSKHYGLPMTNDAGPTQDCNIWMTDNAVYIDTAGGWVQQDGMDANALSAWRVLLKLIRKTRRYPALDGIMLCLGADWLMQSSTIERKALIDALRARILETAAWFRADLPIYLFLNRLDTLPGGASLLSAIPPSQLAQGVGMTLAIHGDGDAFVQDIERLYHKIENGLQQQMLSTAHAFDHTNDHAMPPDALLGIESIGQLRPIVLDMSEQLFPQAALGFSGKLRGIWLGSSTTAPNANAEFSEPIALGISYQQAFQLAVQERGIVANCAATRRRFDFKRGSAFAALLLLPAGMCLFLAFNFAKERDYMASAKENFAQSRRLAQDVMGAPDQQYAPIVRTAEQLRYMDPLLSTLQADYAPLSGDPYFELKKTSHAIDKTYLRHLHKSFWPEVQRYVGQTLAQEVELRNNDVYETLKIYLMLAQPELRDREEIQAWFKLQWKKLAPAGSTTANKTHFENSIQALFSASQPALPAMTMDKDLVHRVRIFAANLPLATRVMASIQSMPVPQEIQGVSLATAAGPNALLALRRNSQATISEIAIPAIYTKLGFEQILLPHLDAIANKVQKESHWVLDSAGSADSLSIDTAAQSLSDTVYRLYLQNYADQWHAFLQDIRLRQVASLSDAAELSSMFADKNSPLAKLIKFASAETTLEAKNRDSYSLHQATRSFQQKKDALLSTLSGDAAAINSLSRRLVDDRFASLHALVPAENGQETVPWTQWFSDLSSQMNALSSALRTGQIMPQADIMTRLRSDANRQPDPLKSIMNDLIQIGDTQMIQQSRKQIAMNASGLDSAICSRTIAGRYPFNRQAKTEIGMDDFNKVFSRSGSFQDFFDKNLASYVDTNTRPWSARKVGGDAIIVQDKTLRSFENAALIRNMFFNGSDKINFSMMIKPLELDASILEAVLDIDGQTIVYSHGPQQSMRIEWPGPKGGVYARLSLRLLDNQIKTINFEGPWALFRLFDRGRQQRIGNNQRNLAIETEHGKFGFEIRPSSQDFPLWSPALTAFQCPA